MRNSFAKFNLRVFIASSIVLTFVAAMPLISSARVNTSSINIVNNSNREIRHVYLSHVDADDWTADQLNNASIAAGQSATLSNVSWDAQQVRLIAEDQDGCFSYGVVTYGGSSSWTLTNSTAVDCGS